MTARGMVKAMLRRQSFACLATVSQRGPYTSLIAVAVTSDLREIVFATERTRKYRNVAAHPRVALLFDDRTNTPADIERAVAVTALGRAMLARGADRVSCRALFCRRHPALVPFVASPATLLLRVRISEYLVVTRFRKTARVVP